MQTINFAPGEELKFNDMIYNATGNRHSPISINFVRTSNNIPNIIEYFNTDFPIVLIQLISEYCNGDYYTIYCEPVVSALHLATTIVGEEMCTLYMRVYDKQYFDVIIHYNYAKHKSNFSIKLVDMSEHILSFCKRNNSIILICEGTNQEIKKTDDITYSSFKQPRKIRDLTRPSGYPDILPILNAYIKHQYNINEYIISEVLLPSRKVTTHRIIESSTDKPLRQGRYTTIIYTQEHTNNIYDCVSFNIPNHTALTSITIMMKLLIDQLRNIIPKMMRTHSGILKESDEEVSASEYEFEPSLHPDEDIIRLH